MLIKQEELDEMKVHPAARALWKYLRREIQSLTEQWQDGALNHDDPNVCKTANVEAVSKIELLKRLIEIDAEDLNEEELGANREQLGLPPSRTRSPAESG